MTERKTLVHKYKNALTLLLSSALFFAIFLRILTSVIDQGKITLIDKNINNFIINLRTEWLTDIFKAITILGNPTSVVIITVICLMFLYFRGHKRYALTLGLISFIDIAFIYISKLLVARERPPINLALIQETDFSFPSGHTLFALCFYGLLIYFFLHLIKKNWQKLLLITSGTIIIILIGLSRIYLGVHWTSDVIASLAIGLSWISLVILYWQESGNSAKI